MKRIQDIWILATILALSSVSWAGQPGDPCFNIIELEVECTPDLNGDIVVGFVLENPAGSTFPVDRIFLWVESAGGYSITPDEFILGTPLLPGQSTGLLTVTITGAISGEIICPSVSIHDSTTGACCGAELCITVPRCEDTEFIRGDCNRDGALDISDAITLIAFLFLSGTLTCDDACDFNDDGVLNVADAIAGLLYVFASGPPPPSPFPGCGPDPTADLLDCASYPPCP